MTEYNSSQDKRFEGSYCTKDEFENEMNEIIKINI